MISQDQAIHNFFKMWGPDEEKDFFTEVDPKSDQALVDAMESENPHAYINLLIIKHKGDQEAVLNELSEKATQYL